MKMMRDICKCAKSICHTTIDTSAYYRGLSELKGINLSKHRKQINKEMTKEEELD